MYIKHNRKTFYDIYLLNFKRCNSGCSSTKQLNFPTSLFPRLLWKAVCIISETIIADH